MKQTKAQSIAETIASTAVGYVIAVLTQIAVFPWFGINVKYSQNIMIALVFTVISLIRGYCIRRLFNWWHHKAQ